MFSDKQPLQLCDSSPEKQPWDKYIYKAFDFESMKSFGSFKYDSAESFP